MSEVEWAPSIFIEKRNNKKPHVVDFDHCVFSYYDGIDKTLISYEMNESSCRQHCIECAGKNWEGRRHEAMCISETGDTRIILMLIEKIEGLESQIDSLRKTRGKRRGDESK